MLGRNSTINICWNGRFLNFEVSKLAKSLLSLYHSHGIAYEGCLYYSQVLPEYAYGWELLGNMLFMGSPMDFFPWNSNVFNRGTNRVVMEGIGKIITFPGYSIPHWLEKNGWDSNVFYKGVREKNRKPIYHGGRECQALRSCFCLHSQIRIFE